MHLSLATGERILGDGAQFELVMKARPRPRPPPPPPLPPPTTLCIGRPGSARLPAPARARPPKRASREQSEQSSRWPGAASAGAAAAGTAGAHLRARAAGRLRWRAASPSLPSPTAPSLPPPPTAPWLPPGCPSAASLLRSLAATAAHPPLYVRPERHPRMPPPGNRTRICAAELAHALYAYACLQARSRRPLTDWLINYLIKLK